MTAEEVYAILKKQIQSGGGDSDSGSSDDSASPIVETYNGQTIQCSMSADRPLKGLNLYATTEQVTTTGAQLFDGSLAKKITIGGITTEWLEDEQCFLLNGTCAYNDSFGLTTLNLLGKKEAEYVISSEYISGNITVPEGKYCSACLGSADIPDENSDWMATELSTQNTFRHSVLPHDYITNFWFYINEGVVLDNYKVRLMFCEGSTVKPYEPYTGGKPSPSPEYPQEIQTISDFAVEVKNSMGEVTTPQTLNVTIPEQGFYGIPVSADGNYTDSSGQQWICDEFDFANKKFIKRIGRFSLDGSEDETWGKSTTGKDHQQFRTNFPKAPNNSGWCLCNRFIYGSGVREVGYCFVWNSGFFICVELSIDTVELLRDYLNTHPLDVIYLLETPVEYDLTDEQVEQFKKLKSYYGTTYIDNGAVPACNMQAELVLDTKLYIDSKFATLAGQIIEDSSFIVNGNEEPYPSGGTGSQDKPDDPADDFADDDDMI